MSELEELKERVRILERRSRRLRNVGIGVALFVVAGLAFAQQRQASAARTLEADRLILRYPNGREAIVLAAEKDDLGQWARASFYTPTGSPGFAISSRPSGTVVTVSSPKDAVQMQMQTGETFSRSENRPVAEFAGLRINKTPQRGGITPLLFIMSESTGKSAQYMYSEDGSQLRLTNGPDGAALELLDKQTVRAVMGKTSLETVRSGSVETLPLSSLVLFDKDGKVLFRAP